MINYAIPGLYSHFDINIKLLRLRENRPEFFYPNINIEAAYGTFPWNIFDGGRIFNYNKHVSTEEIKDIVFQYHTFGVMSRLVYTNSQLTPTNYTNRFGNLCLDICNNYSNQVVVADDNFRNYIHQEYPNLSFISSTTKCLNAKDFKIELNKPEFAEICLDYNLNHHWKLLNELNDEEKSKCEFLANAICPPGCITRRHHYELNGRYNLNFGRYYIVPYCELHHHQLSPECKNYNNNISYEEIVESYEPKGFCHFKLEGRTFTDLAQVIIYANYMAKPEYKDEFIANILEDR